MFARPTGSAGKSLRFGYATKTEAEERFRIGKRIPDRILEWGHRQVVHQLTPETGVRRRRHIHASLGFSENLDQSHTVGGRKTTPDDIGISVRGLALPGSTFNGGIFANPPGRTLRSGKKAAPPSQTVVVEAGAFRMETNCED
ncbi:aminoglycoside N(6')-acetyltransferase [Anopheles sinensis]|uniref:Aminoglycoside N(6')-acetyltransferase n=1 Tax=Anopheles sinensis TaxID=74873 RepID=A0A084VEP7_ANOSI|nr:aminoglycoside N(6')-acetyltransferase [Anopheles sinensis]